MIYTPKPFHSEMIEWLLSHDEAALWASPGLGKTAVTLMLNEEIYPPPRFPFE